ncbi:MAG TPA: amidohydrolase family protein [Candidatus Methylomirabilis sp.]|nr:amidohydrolase family protein [Candidatus Methylomirabilis sp.]
MSYRIISADCHIDMTWMPGDLWVENAPAKFRSQVPQVRETPDGPRWYAEEKELGVFGGLGFGFDRVQRSFSKHVERMFQAGFYEGGPHPTTPDLRLKDQEIDGIDAEVMYGILGAGMRMQDRELIRVVYEVYNDWAASFCKSNPRRFVALACIPNHDPQAAARELRRAARLGLKGADFAVGNAIVPIYHGAWDPLWEAAQECQMPISFHTVGYPVREPTDETMKAEYNLRYRATRTTMFQIGAAEYLASIVFSGALDRFPSFKFVLGEAGVSWLPYILDRMDEEYEDRYHVLNLSMKPSELWRRQGYSTYQHEPSVVPMIPLIGEDTIMWGSDYPHPDGIWPDSQHWIAKDLAGASPAVQRKILCENAGKLYGLL